MFLAIALYANQHDDDVAELMRLERVWNQAHVSGDAVALDQLWADDLVVTVQGMPTMSKAQSMAIWRSGKMTFAAYDTSDVIVRVHGDAAVVTGRVHRSRKLGERMANDNWLFTKTYVRRSGRWQVVAWHASDAPGP
jgi:ketosteroid isomerase-like protein